MQQLNMDNLLQEISRYPLEDQEFIVNTLTRRIHEARRAQILERAQNAERNYQSGKVSTGTARDLMMGLNDA